MRQRCVSGGLREMEVSVGRTRSMASEFGIPPASVSFFTNSEHTLAPSADSRNVDLAVCHIIEQFAGAAHHGLHVFENMTNCPIAPIAFHIGIAKTDGINGVRYNKKVICAVDHLQRFGSEQAPNPNAHRNTKHSLSEVRGKHIINRTVHISVKILSGLIIILMVKNKIYF